MEPLKDPFDALLDTREPKCQSFCDIPTHPHTQNFIIFRISNAILALFQSHMYSGREKLFHIKFTLLMYQYVIKYLMKHH